MNLRRLYLLKIQWGTEATLEFMVNPNPEILLDHLKNYILDKTLRVVKIYGKFREELLEENRELRRNLREY